MQLIPAGWFHMGSSIKKKKDEHPYRLVYLDAFYMDRTPVTCARYRAFMEKTGQKAPPGLAGLGPDEPVVGVTWDDAVAYSRWALKRLPTEAEWEKAARGVDGRKWPWGNDEPVDGEHAHFGRTDGAAHAVGQLAAGASPFGCLDMAGGVWEWCHDQYDQWFYKRAEPRNPRCDDSDTRYRVARGGAVNYSAFNMRAAFRGFNLPHMRSSQYGFRCASETKPYRKKR